MPLLRINARGDVPECPTGEPFGQAIRSALAPLAPGAPVVIMVHGYKHSPYQDAHCPHDHVLSLEPRRDGRFLSWPKHLGFGLDAHEQGLAIGFGWHARGSIWQAYRGAGAAGDALARLVAEVAPRHDGPVHLFAHSLGARVSLRALSSLPAGHVSRVVLMAGAEFTGEAEMAILSPAGRRAEILNVTSGENRVFDLMFERLLQYPAGRSRALGAGLADPPARWIDLRIDDVSVRARLAAIGYRIPPPTRPVCHWSGYLRPGLFALYRSFLTDPAPLPLSALRAGIPAAPVPVPRRRARLTEA